MPKYRKGEIRVTFREGVRREHAETIIRSAGLMSFTQPERPTIMGRVGLVYKLRVAESYEDAYVARLKTNPYVLTAERFIERD